MTSSRTIAVENKNTNGDEMKIKILRIERDSDEVTKTYLDRHVVIGSSVHVIIAPCATSVHRKGTSWTACGWVKLSFLLKEHSLC